MCNFPVILNEKNNYIVFNFELGVFCFLSIFRNNIYFGNNISNERKIPFSIIIILLFWNNNKKLQPKRLIENVNIVRKWIEIFKKFFRRALKAWMKTENSFGKCIIFPLWQIVTSFINAIFRYSRSVFVIEKVILFIVFSNCFFFSIIFFSKIFKKNVHLRNTNFNFFQVNNSKEEEKEDYSL